MVLTELLGVLGFILSVFVFIITRLEKRKSLIIDMFACCDNEFPEEWGTDENFEEEFVILKIINNGIKPITINSKSFQIFGNGKCIDPFYCDWFGMSNVSHPIKPGECSKIGILLAVFEQGLEIDKITDKYEKIGIYCKLKDLEGKSYTNKGKYAYIPEVGEFEKIK